MLAMMQKQPALAARAPATRRSALAVRASATASKDKIKIGINGEEWGRGKVLDRGSGGQGGRRKVA